MVNVLNVVGMLKQFERFTGFQKFYNCWVNSLTFKNSLLARTLTPTQPPPPALAVSKHLLLGAFLINTLGWA